MDIRSIISKLDEIQESPAVGDVVYLEFGNTLEVETTIVDVNGEDIVLEADDKLLGLLEDLNQIEERKIYEGSVAYVESGLQYYTGKKKYGKEGMAALAAAGRKGASQEELGRIKDKYLKKEDSVEEAGDPSYNKYIIPYLDVLIDAVEQGRAATRSDPRVSWYRMAMRALDKGYRKTHHVESQRLNNALDAAGIVHTTSNTNDAATATKLIDYMKNLKQQGESIANEAAPNKAQTLAQLEDLIEEMEMRLEREVEWAMTDHYDSATVQKLLAPINQSLDNLKRFVVQQQSETELGEAEYQGRNVPLGKPMRGDVKKFKVYVRDPSTGNVKKVNFGDKTMRIKKSNPKRRKSFRARHNCANPGPRTKARYWSCRKW